MCVKFRWSTLSRIQRSQFLPQWDLPHRTRKSQRHSRRWVQSVEEGCGGWTAATHTMRLPWPPSSTPVFREFGSWSQELSLIDPKSFLLEFLSQEAPGQIPAPGLRISQEFLKVSGHSARRKTELQRDTKDSMFAGNKTLCSAVFTVWDPPITTTHWVRKRWVKAYILLCDSSD